jgi:hypothetical protein
LVPHFLEEADRELGVEDTAALIGALLRLGSGESPGARLFGDLPPDWDDYWMIGTFNAGAVRQIADVFAHATLDAWVSHYSAALADAATGLGYSGGQRDWLLKALLSAAREVAALFIAAAAEHEAVIFRVVV